jgi:hypothetical protein
LFEYTALVVDARIHAGQITALAIGPAAAPIQPEAIAYAMLKSANFGQTNSASLSA